MLLKPIGLVAALQLNLFAKIFALLEAIFSAYMEQEMPNHKADKGLTNKR